MHEVERGDVVAWAARPLDRLRAQTHAPCRRCDRAGSGRPTRCPSPDTCSRRGVSTATGRHDDAVAGHDLLDRAVGGVEDDPHAGGSSTGAQDLDRLGADGQVARTGGECPSHERVVRAVLGVDGAGVADALRTADARGRPKRGTLLSANGIGPQVHPSRSAAAPYTSRNRPPGKRWHRVRPARGVRAVSGPSSPGDADLPFRSLVVRGELVVAEGPVGERAALRRAVGARHGEVLGHEPPRLPCQTRVPPPIAIALRPHVGVVESSASQRRIRRVAR